MRVKDADPPVPGPGESLIQVTAVGICGSDLHWFAEGGIGGTTVTRPVVPGHEFGGIVQSGPLAGRAVAVDPAISCGTCARCHEGNSNLCPEVVFAGHGTCDGALREYLTWPDRLLHPVPDALAGTGAALLEPLGVAIHAFDLGHVRLGASVAIVGCGPIGLLLMQVARAGGAGPVVAVEPLTHRRTLAASYALGPAVAPTDDLAGTLASAGVPDGVDVVFEAAGTDAAVAAATELVRPGGRVVLAGIPDTDATALPASTARRKGLTIAMVRRMREVYPRAIRLASEGAVDLDRLVTDRFPLDDAPAAFATAVARTGIKTVITPASTRG
ncbi:MAG: alcohol dehydrogenase catalytic domain-containing protein [Micromonosporaceae bacterium]|nr:alcohol dehydrogenase catalytic domain-containing protein [Micromonosporaceae bacterium]